MSSKQEEVLVKAFLDAKAQVQELIAEAKRIDNSLNLAWSAYTKRDLPRDLGGSRPENKAPTYDEIQEADEFMASGAAPAGGRLSTRPPSEQTVPRRVPPRRKKI